MITKEEYVDWRANPVTKALFEACKERELGSIERLIGNSADDPVMDYFWKGFITAYRDIQDLSFEDMNED